jgi:AcrR family transcriptional regulator
MREHCPIKNFIRRRRKDARPGEILTAALDVFGERGFAATRLDDIAARAGVSKGTLYLYFDNKEALFKAAIEATMTPAIEAAEELAADTGRPASELLREFVLGWWDQVGSTPLGALPKLLVAEGSNFPELARWFHDTLINRAHAAMTRIIELGIDRGEFRPVPPPLAARIVFSPMFSFIIWRRSFPDFMCGTFTPEQFLNQAIDMLVHGMATEKQPS